MALDVEDERIQGPFPPGQIERVVAQGDPGDLPAAMLHVDREFPTLVPERRQLRRLDFRLDNGRHQGGLALPIQVVWCEVDRIDRLDDEEPRPWRREEIETPERSEEHTSE